MFCQNCGKELPNTAKFCDSCGTPQNPGNPSVAPTVENNYVNDTTQVNTTTSNTNSSIPYKQAAHVVVSEKKKSNGCLIAVIISVILIVLVVVGIVAVCIFGFNTAKDILENTEIAISEDVNIDSFYEESDTVNAEYAEIFSSRNLIDSPALFIGLESRAFANVSGDQTVDKMEFGYENDTVKELKETIYYPIADLDSNTISQLDTAMKEAFKKASELSFCTVTYETTADYYIITIHSTQMDNATNLKALYDADVLVYDGFVTSLSMSQTAQGLISKGYVER